MTTDIVKRLRSDAKKKKINYVETTAADEIERLRNGIEACYKMLLSDPYVHRALEKAELMLRDLLKRSGE